MTKSLVHEMNVKVKVHAQEYAEDRLDILIYHCYREMHFIAFYCIIMTVTAWNMKCRSRSPGQSTCLKSILRTVIIMQEYISITAAEKHTLQHRFMSVNGA